MLEFERSSQAELSDTTTTVKVLGIGGAGSNVIDRIALEGLTEAELLTLNTDVRALTTSVTNDRIQLGAELTHGLGAGGDPSIGEAAALAAEDEIRASVKGRKMVFLCAGLGGGTGSGAAPVVARIARDEGAFVVAFTNMPFKFEGARRLEQAQIALDALRREVHAMVAFDNDRMGELVLPKMGIQEAFVEADKIISQSVRAIISLVGKPGLIRIGMDDLLTALKNTDARCLFGHGVATGDNRAQAALASALKSPLLDKGQLLQKAKNVLVHVCGGSSMTLYEVELLMKDVSKHVHPDAHVLFGVCSDAKLGEELSVTLITSMAAEAQSGGAPSWSLFSKKSETAPAPAQIHAPVPTAATAPLMESAPALEPDPVPDLMSEGEEELGEEGGAEEFVAPPDPGASPPPEAMPAGVDPDPYPTPEASHGPVPTPAPPPPVVAAAPDPVAESEQTQPLNLSPTAGADAGVDPGLEATRHPDSPFSMDALADDGDGASATPAAQQDLPLDPDKGRFDHAAPTIEDGEDLDVPTFLRKKKRKKKGKR